MTAELIRATPTFLAPAIAKAFYGRDRAWDTIFEILQPIVQERLNCRYTIPNSQKPVSHEMALQNTGDNVGYRLIVCNG